MELLFLVIILIIFLAANWVAENITLIMSIIVVLFAISIIRNICGIVQNKKEEHYIDGELILFIVIKVISCVGLCFLVKYLF